MVNRAARRQTGNYQLKLHHLWLMDGLMRHTGVTTKICLNVNPQYFKVLFKQKNSPKLRYSTKVN